MHYIYIYIHLIRHGHRNRQDIFVMVSFVFCFIVLLLGFRRRMRRVLMASVVDLFVHGFHRGRTIFCLWYPSLDLLWILPPQEDPKC